MTKFLKYSFALLLLLSVFANISAQKLKHLKGKPFPKKVLEAKLYTQTGETIKFKKVLKELKGNVIYLDFWASWCGPCNREMPKSKKVQKYFKDKNVAFLYLSTDKEQEKWLNGMKRIDIKGHHYQIALESKILFKDLFHIPGIPYYAIIDKKGNIAEPRASWPREEKLLNEISDVLNKQ